MKTDILNRLAEDWKDSKSVVLYGAGAVSERNIDLLSKEFIIPFIIDNNPQKQGAFLCGIPVYSETLVSERLREHKIVVMTGSGAYRAIRRSLRQKGLEEFCDFCSLEQFVIEWNWRYRNKACLLQVNMAVSMTCTLNCGKCNMFIPYYKNKFHYSQKEVKRSIDALFSKVDYVYNFVLLGGEPFVNPELGGILDDLYSGYGERIGLTVLVTNGTITPSDEILQKMKQYHIEVNISDYRNAVNYDSKFSRLQSALQERGIRFLIKKSLEWCDFGFPEKENVIPEEEVPAHMRNCSPLFHGLNDEKFYYCHVSWSAEKCGKYQLPETDYVKLDNQEEPRESVKEKILRHSLGEFEKGFMSFCRICGGCGTDNTEYVPAGIQVRQTEME